MNILEPTKNKALRDYITSHAGSDYQEYLVKYDASYAQSRFEMFCNSENGETFGLFSNKKVTSIAKLVELPWDTDCFKFSTAKISAIFGTNVKDKTELMHEIINHAYKKNIRLLTCRISSNDYSSIHALEKVGFRIVDSMNVFIFDSSIDSYICQVDSKSSKRIAIEPLSRDDEDTFNAIKKLVISSFENGRLRNDPNISSEQERLFYSNLLESLIDNKESVSLVAWDGEQPIGFVCGAKDDELSKYLSDSIGYLWIIAIDNAFKGKGIGKILLEEFLCTISRSVRYIEIGTQSNNYPALNLYASSGLKIVSSLVTMHYWLNED